MSKRAEELAEQVETCYHNPMIKSKNRPTEAAAMIDAELRKERERCAERFKARVEQWEPASATAMQIKGVLLTDGVDVILEAD